MRLQFSGRYKLQVEHGDTGIVLRETPWFDNLITDAGLNALGNGFDSVCYVGSGNTPPTVADTQLQSQLARSTSKGNLQSGVQVTTEPYYGRFIRSYSFDIGAVQGTVREVGIGVGNPTPTLLFSRSLLVDENGSVTELTLSGIDRLTVFYEFRQCIPTGDTAAEIEINGATYDCLVRASFIEFRGAWAADYECGARLDSSVSLGPDGIGNKVKSGVDAFVGGDSGTTPPYVGPLNDQPTGTPIPASSIVNEAYVDLSLKRGWYAFWGTEKGNLTINAIRTYAEKYSVFGSGFAHPIGTWQFSLIPAVVKTNLQSFRINGEFSWERCTP